MECPTRLIEIVRGLFEWGWSWNLNISPSVCFQAYNSLLKNYKCHVYTWIRNPSRSQSPETEPTDNGTTPKRLTFQALGPVKGGGHGECHVISVVGRTELPSRSHRITHAVDHTEYYPVDDTEYYPVDHMELSSRSHGISHSRSHGIIH